MVKSPCYPVSSPPCVAQSPQLCQTSHTCPPWWTVAWWWWSVSPAPSQSSCSPSSCMSSMSGATSSSRITRWVQSIVRHAGNDLAEPGWQYQTLADRRITVVKNTVLIQHIYVQENPACTKNNHQDKILLTSMDLVESKKRGGRKKNRGKIKKQIKRWETAHYISNSHLIKAYRRVLVLILGILDTNQPFKLKNIMSKFQYRNRVSDPNLCLFDF